MSAIDIDALAVKLAGVAGAAISMRYLQGSPLERVSMAAGGAVMAYYASPYISQNYGVPEGLTGFLIGMFGMSIMYKVWIAIQNAPVREFWAAVIERVRGR